MTHGNGKGNGLAEIMVQTAKGLLPESELVVTTEEFNERDVITTAREWRYHGELVRRDVWVVAKRGPELGAAHAALG